MKPKEVVIIRSKSLLGQIAQDVLASDITRHIFDMGGGYAFHGALKVEAAFVAGMVPSTGGNFTAMDKHLVE